MLLDVLPEEGGGAAAVADRTTPKGRGRPAPPAAILEADGEVGGLPLPLLSEPAAPLEVG